MVEKIVKTVEDLNDLLIRVKKAQKAFSEYSQEDVDRIFKAVALASDKASLKLAQDAVSETGIGNVEDKVIKNKYASEFIYNEYKDTKTCGIIERDESKGEMKVAAPLGVLAAVIPCTNPTSTAIFKCLLALKTRNGLIFSPHPRAKKCTIEAIKICYEAAVKAGAPKDIIGWIDEPSIETSKLVMKECDCTLATGGPGMVFSAYSSGKPAIGVGPGNAPVIVDSSADLASAAASIIHSKSFDNGTICASEQNCIVLKNVYEEFKKDLIHYGAYIIKKEDMDKVRKVIMVPSRANPNVCSVNPSIVGKTAYEIAKLSGVEVPETTRILVGEIEKFDISEGFAHEKLSPVLSLISADNFDKALAIAEDIVEHGGHGHTADLYVNPNQTKKIEAFAETIETCRLLINTPSSQGGIGGIYSSALPASLTLGCGSWGGNSTWQNVGVENLLNIKTVALRQDVNLEFVSSKIFKSGSSLKDSIRFVGKNHKKAAIFFGDASRNQAKKVESRFLKEGFKVIECVLKREVSRNEALKASKQVKMIGADLLVAVGGNDVISFAKLTRLLLADPKIDLEDLSMDYLDSSKKIVSFPKVNATLLVIPTSPFDELALTKGAIVSLDKEEKKVLFDDSLLADVVAFDKKLFIDVTDEELALDAYFSFGSALSSYVSMLASEKTDSFAKKAIKEGVEIFGKNKFNNSKLIELGADSAIALGNTNGGLFESIAFAASKVYGVSYKAAGSVILAHILQLFTAKSVVSKMGTFANYVKPLGRSKFASLSKKLHFKGNGESELVEAFKEWVDSLRVKYHLPTTWADLGITPSKLKKLGHEAAVEAFIQSGSSASPLYPRIENIERFIVEL